MTSSSESTGVAAGVRPPSAADRRPANLPLLTGMRGVAAVLVMLFHATLFNYFANPGIAQQYSALTDQGGWAAVTFFFILSGFVLTWSMRPGDRARTFWRRRFWKIYPSYLVGLGAGVLFALSFPGAVDTPVVGPGVEWNPGRALMDVLLIQSWHPDVLVRTSYNQPLWSLSAEAYFYLLFPVLVVLISRVRPERLWAWVGGVVAAIVAVPTVANLLPPGEAFPNFPMSGTELWLVVHFPGTRILEFVVGIFMARIVMTGRRVPLSLGGAVALTVTAYLLSSYVPLRYGVIAIMVVPLALLVAAAAVKDASGRPSFLGNRVWVWLGNISFAVYLLHYPVMITARALLGDRTFGSWAAAGLIALLCAVSVVLAALVHHLVELPLMRRFGSRHGRKAGEAPAPLRPAPEAADERQAAAEPDRRAA